MFSLDQFINTYVTKREKSMFADDVERHRTELQEQITGKSVLVIGGAGSIGSATIRAILPYSPSELVIVDTNENALTELTRSLRSSAGLSQYMPETYLPYPMDYNSVTFKRMFKDHRRPNGNIGFDIVANFSAHKHVRSEKDIYSVEAMVRNNLINAQGLMDLLEECPPEHFFCVSTDKAAGPVNIMGCTKRLLEDLAFSYSNAFPVSTARFANVAFSNGSLPQGFLERMRQLQPLSAPLDIRRYFVSPEESGQICMLASMLGSNRNIFFPKLSEPTMTTFDAIARDLLQAHGYEVVECGSDQEAIEKAEGLKRGSKKYPVHFSVSDTSGEKLFEEFYTDGESIDFDTYSSLGVITDKPVPSKAAVSELIEDLDIAFEKGADKAEIVSIMKSYLPNFRHIETGKSLDSKM